MQSLKVWVMNFSNWEFSLIGLQYPYLSHHQCGAVLLLERVKQEENIKKKKKNKTEKINEKN